MRKWQLKELEAIPGWGIFAATESVRKQKRLVVRNPKIDLRLQLEPLRTKTRSIFNAAETYFKKEEEKLRYSLREIMHVAVKLVPEPFNNILASFSDQKYNANHEEQRKWERDIIDEILSLTKPDRSEWTDDTAVCPLCGDVSQKYYARGFTYPEGLSRHLRGWGQAQQCRVMQVAKKLARETWIDLKLRESPEFSDEEVAYVRRFGMTKKEDEKNLQKAKERCGF